MPLNELKEDLYSSNSKIFPTNTHESSEYDPAKVVASQSSPFDEQQNWNQPQKGLSPKQKKILWVVVPIFSAIILVLIGFFIYSWWQKNAFHQDRVLISFEGPKEVDSTQSTKYIIHYKNDNRVTLKNAEIRLSYSENFQPIDNVNLKYLSPGSSKIFIGDIKPKSEGVAELNGIFYAPKDFPVYLYASINFIPSNGTEILALENQIGINITAAPALLDVTAPQETVSGYDISYVIDYKNLDTKLVNDMQVRIDFPQGFKISDAQPVPSEKDSYWYLGNLESEQSGKITIRGQLKGDSGDQKSIVVSLGRVGSNGNFVVFNRQEYSTHMVSPVLAVSQSLDNKESNIINAGERLAYTISYKNTGPTGLRDAIITAQVTGKILDFSKISVTNGSYDSKTGLMTWKASDVPSLQNIDSQASGSVHFSIPVKSIIPVENKQDKNFVVSSVANIDSPDIPVADGSNKIIGSDKLELKLASKVLFNVYGYYTDPKIKNSGPIPMQVGLPTTFAIHWSVMNASNDISNAKVVSSLPAGLRWTGKIYPSNEKITYNERTNQIVWEAGNISAGVGILVPPHEVVFQVETTPQTSQAGEPVVLINEANFTAKDDFVGQDVTLKADKKDTQLSEDSSVGYAKGKVAVQGN